MSNFKIKKKVLKTSKLSIFSTIFKLSFIPQKSIFHIFFEEFVFFGELFIIYYIFYTLHPLKNAIYPPKIVISCFFYGICILGGTFDNLHIFYCILTLKNYHLSPENQYFVFFLWNSHFGRNIL